MLLTESERKELVRQFGLLSGSAISQAMNCLYALGKLGLVEGKMDDEVREMVGELAGLRSRIEHLEKRL